VESSSEGSVALTRRASRAGILLLSLHLAATVFPANAYSTATAPSDRLSRGIELFRVGRVDEALTELRAVVEVRPHTPLAYYYAAQIRYGKGQYSQARKNLLAALEDSTDFHDASGMLACTDLKMRNVTDALIEWRRFTAGVGVLNPGEPVTERSIMLPAEYREKLSRARISAGIDSAASRSLSASSRAVGRTDTVRAADAALRDLNRRIESRIRTGYYAIGGAIALLFAGALFTMLWMRRRRKSAAEPTFESEVDRLVGGVTERDEFDLGEEEPIAAPEPVRSLPGPESRAPVTEAPPPREHPLEYPARKYDEEEAAPARSAVAVSPPDGARQPITEEVKILVTRLHREGHSIVDIARIADLTRTEVELIVAVRTRRTEQLIEAATVEEDMQAPDALREAVRELAAEGRGVPEIARRLGISTSEVKLAIAVMEKRRGR
jgi:tetratricopeptide (TPR) repeat protein